MHQNNCRSAPMIPPRISRRRSRPARLWRTSLLEQMEPRLLLTAYAFNTLASFDSTAFDPVGTLVQDSTGNLFGTTESGGNNFDGTVFELPHGLTVVTTLALFNASTGIRPTAGLTMDQSGNLFGTTAQGGSNNLGTVFEVAAGSTAITTLASFSSAPWSGAGLTLDSADNLFGTTNAGGDNSMGSVFEIAHGTTGITTFASFNGTNGVLPRAAVIFDTTGNLFGTTYGNGRYNGTIFEIASGSTTITALASFVSQATSASPVAALVVDPAGNLFGTTEVGGGTHNDGAVFELAKGTTKDTLLASFNSVTTPGPSALTRDSSGNLFGATDSNGQGTVYEVGAGTSSITTLASFADDTLGQVPGGGVVLDASGDLLGMTLNGGANGDGAVFELTPIPSWLASTSAATWNASTHLLTVTGPSTIIADPGSDEPYIVANGSAAQLTIAPTVSDIDVHVGGVTLTNGAGVTVASVGSGRSHGNHNTLVIGTQGGTGDPTFSIDATSKFDLQDNDLLVHTGTTDTNGSGELAAVQALARTGRDGSAWDGNQLTSTSAQTQNNNDGLESVQLAVVNNADLPSPLAAWQVGNASESLGGHDIIVKYTYTGDFNLDGQVNFNDSCIFGLYYDNGATANNEWAFGDTNGDGKLTFADSSNFGLDFGNGTAAGIDTTQL